MARQLPVTLGPVTLDEGTLTMRSPRLRDAAAWSSARLANRKWLERAFPAWGPDWAAEQSPAAWVQRVRTLRDQQRRGACPFVVFLDGRLIGEVGVDALDAHSGSGEASAWLVRDHGSAEVMLTASVLLIGHAFGRTDPLDRILSPVATTSRKGRAPGLSAVGFEIEATMPRPVVHGGEAVEHDMWIVHNTPAVRAAITDLRARLDRAPTDTTAVDERPTLRQLAPLVPALARTAVRTGRARLSRRDAPADPHNPLLEVTTDVGTDTVSVVPRTAEPAAEIIAAVAGLAENTTSRVEVRLAPPVRHLAAGLAELDFAHLASYRANPDGPHAYPGEQVWGRPAR